MHDIQKKIVDLWETGKTAGEIGKLLEISRNSVMGHLYRLRQAGVKMRQRSEPVSKTNPPPKKPIGVQKMPRRAPAPRKLTFAEIEVIRDPTPSGKPVPLIELKSSSCRYVVSGQAPKDYLFCNEQRQEESSYCPHHHKICYVAKSSIRDLRAKAAAG